MSNFKRFNRKRLRLQDLSERAHLLDLSILLTPEDCRDRMPDQRYRKLARMIHKARSLNAPVVVMMGAHLLRSGAAGLLIELMESGLITHIAMNGAGPVHDFEMALIGKTTESVARYITDGRFGLWKETGRINDIISRGSRSGKGFGEAVGEVIQTGEFPHKDISILAAGYRLGIPVTVHVGIGYDIIHEHPNCDAAAVGITSYEDFLIFANTVEHLEHGVVLNFGTAVMGPEVFLKALAMARNIAEQEHRKIENFTTAVFDLAEIGEFSEEPSNQSHKYYFRPLKTMLLRSVQSGGKSYYFKGLHKSTFPTLYNALKTTDEEGAS